MPAPYNSSELVNQTNIWDKVVFLNNSAEGTIGLFLLLLIATVIYFILSKRGSQVQALGATSFIALIFGLLFFIGGLIDAYYLGIVGVFALIGLGAMYSKGGN